MPALLSHALFGLSVAALGDAGLRLASPAAPAGLQRALAAAALAVAAAVLEALLLGTVGLGGNPVALATGAGAIWLAARTWLPRPARGPFGELRSWWGRLVPVERIALGGLAGAGSAWAAWLLRNPVLGYDTLLYHLSESVAWVESGSPGSVEQIVNGLPVGSYPVTHEVLAGWALGVAGSFVPISLLPPLVAALTAAAGWSCLRTLGVSKLPSGLAVGALLASPAVIAYGRSGAALDPAALAWLCTAAALAAGSRSRPLLVAPTLVAAGLAAGTKTTVLPLAAAIVLLALAANRGRLLRMWPPLLLGAAAALALSMTWYVRNLVEHGSPFWPFLTLPGGDAAPPAVAAADISFLDRPGDTLARLDSIYLDQFAGGIVLLACALAVAFAARRRAVTLASMATGLSLLLWLNAPLTGVSDNPGFDQGTADAVRYLLPGLAAAVLTLALAARVGGAARTLALAGLALGLGLNVVQSFGLGFPSAPSALTVLAGAALGALAGVMAGRVRLSRSRAARRLPGVAGGAAAAAAAGCLLALLAGGYLERHARAQLWDSGLVSWFAARDRDERPVAISGAVHALLAGDRLQRRVELIPARESCAAVSRRRRRGWVVFTQVLRQRGARDVRDCFAGERPSYADEGFRIFAPRPGSGA